MIPHLLSELYVYRPESSLLPSALSLWAPLQSQPCDRDAGVHPGHREGKGARREKPRVLVLWGRRVMGTPVSVMKEREPGAGRPSCSCSESMSAAAGKAPR